MVTVHTLSNGLVLLIEEIPHVESAAYELLIPGGIITDEEGRVGSSLILAELMSRGAGSMDSRAISNAFDSLGAGHSESAGHDRFGFRGMLLADKLESALELVSMMVQKPHLPEPELDSIKSLLMQDLSSLVDNPARRVMIELGRCYYPGVWGRASLGTEEGIQATTIEYVRSDWERRIRPRGAVLSIAGKVRSAEVIKVVERLFGAWSGTALAVPEIGEMPSHRAHHIEFESAQVQIALAYPSARFGDRHFYAAKVASGILSGGMFGRLFIEVREKRGLCYSVYARHAANQYYGTVMAYAGTTPERAQETHDVMLGELRNLRGTVSTEELARAKANLKAGLIIGEESTGARAGSNSSDWWLGKRIRPLSEILDSVSVVDIPAVDAYLDAYPISSFMSVSLGPKAVSLAA
ncbi:MAG: insulinase family protein [Deltaproteobacteria bacterium]|nr:insulinase family protein [Deltaproteobacteria bacterium]